jgi:spore coat protein A, manganese oxidase
MNRRQFLQMTGGAAAFLGLRRRAFAFGQSLPGITKFTVPLPGLGPTGIPVLTPNTTTYPGTDYYQAVVRQFTQGIHPALPSVKFWGYADAANPGSARYLGGVIVAKRNRPVKLKLINRLPSSHILPVDPTVVTAEGGGRVDRVAVHIHGGLVHWTSDGGPFAWFSNPANGGFVHGSSFMNPGSVPGSALYNFPNDQGARLLWYHDHAYGITRLNAYAGIATAYLITDDAEDKLIKSGVLPDVTGYPLGMPLAIQDKTFWDPASDPNYPVGGKQPGDLWYPWEYDPNRWELAAGGAPPPISAVAEAFLDISLVNGAPYPKLAVAPRRYRFRILNGSQARFYNLQLYVADASADAITLQASLQTDTAGNPILVPTNAPGPKIIQIGNEGGFLPLPVVLNDPPLPIGYDLTPAPTNPRFGAVNRYNLVLAPAERADIIVDFRGFEGQSVVLYNDAPAPFPGGDPLYDYCSSALNPNPTPTVPGEGPDTRVLMRFDVGTAGSVRELSFVQTLNALKVSLPIAFLLTQPPPPISSAPPKVKTLNEDSDSYGRLSQKIGVGVGGLDFLSTPTEVASNGQVQTWQIYNLTGDTHPMHFHLVNVKIIKREAWQFNPDGTPVVPLAPIPGTARPPDPNERGWKETVRMNPGEVITVAMKFDLPRGFAPPSPRLQASYGVTGAEYVWHCHILEHEEHDMMHALVVV